MTPLEILQLRDAAELMRKVDSTVAGIPIFVWDGAVDNLEEIAKRYALLARRPAPLLGVDT